ncbi:MAG: MarR family transcriptional regulator [Dermatophilaceae bacterium]
MTGWLGVVSAEHVRRGVSLGIAQIGHGKRAGLARMKEGDTLVYYSPVERLGDRTPLRQFTAIGTIADDVIWQADEGDFKPFRRRVRYEDAQPVSVKDVKTLLRLTSAPNWGYQLRRGLVPLDPVDVAVLRESMLQEVTDGLHSEFNDADDSPGLMLWRVTNTWQAAQRAALQPFDLTHVQFVLLASLTWLRSDTPVTQRDLADHAHTDPMMTSQVLRVLETKGLIRRESHPTDARARALTVSREGSALANAANAAVEATDQTFFGRLHDDQTRFTRMLRRLTESS